MSENSFKIYRNEELRTLMTRSRETVLLAALVGVITGLGVAIFERITFERILEAVLELPAWAVPLAPVVGLGVTAILLGSINVGPATADEYIANFHDRDDMASGPVWIRVLGAVATLGSGVPMGAEGPSIYMGAAVGTAVQARFRRIFGAQQTKALMVAGAAAGVAAVFKAPATGAVFALEVPYQDDVGRRLLLPALVGAASGYLVFASINGTAPLLPAQGTAPFDIRDLFGALVLGVATGLVTRGFAWMLRAAKRIHRENNPLVMVLVGGGLLAALAALAFAVFGSNLGLTPGYNAISWAQEPSRELKLLALLIVIRVFGTVASALAGGVGGLFVPLVVLGALFGRLVGSLFGVPNLSLFEIIGVSAALGAGYRVPLAAVMFVAEATGRPGFVVPGLLAAVGADLVMANSSVTLYQQRSDTVPEYH